jgi:threonine/homoserine/homoserine lactone efflux protein
MNDMLYVLLCGLAIGVLLSAPMGPIGMLVIQRTLSKGRWPAFYTGIGAAVSDLTYCALTGFCISFITSMVDRHQSLLQLVGSAVIACFGVYLFRRNPARALKVAGQQGKTFWKDFSSGFVLTFSNPLILFFIMGLFARFNFLHPGLSWTLYAVGYSGIALGALGWWLLITTGVNKLRQHFNVRSLWLINRIIGSILIVFALVGVANCYFFER